MSTSSTIKLMLMVDTKSNRVIYAEAQKTAVDFLFNILSLPVGRVVNLLRQQEMAMAVTTIDNLYKSLESLEDAYMQPYKEKSSLLTPTPTSSVPTLKLTEPKTPKFYTCYSLNGKCSRTIFTRTYGFSCPTCHDQMTAVMDCLPSPPEIGKCCVGGGVVKGEVPYMVTDDLVVTPMFTASIFPLLNNLNIKDVGLLESKSVDLGMKEAVKILDVMMKSNTVLTDVFLKEEEKGDIVPKVETD